MKIDTSEDRLFVPYRAERVTFWPAATIVAGWGLMYAGAYFGLGWAGISVAIGAQLIWVGEALIRRP